ncbi:MAG: hypothetical protein AAGE65_15060 [Planctomycetota bacterium]
MANAGHVETEVNDDQVQALRVAATRPLRRPLYDPPPAVIVPPPPPPLRLRLVGTILEPGNSQALLRSADGRIAMHPLGATVDEATIDRIEPGRIVVTYHGESRTLTPETP